MKTVVFKKIYRDIIFRKVYLEKMSKHENEAIDWKCNKATFALTVSDFSQAKQKHVNLAFVWSYKNIIFNFNNYEFPNRRRRRKRSQAGSPIAIVSIAPTTSGKSQSGSSTKTSIYSDVFLVDWLFNNDELCNNWHAVQDVDKITNVQGNPQSPAPWENKN